MQWNLAALSDAEAVALLKHFGALVFLLVFYSRWIPRKKKGIYGFQTEWSRNAKLVIADISAGALFSVLLLISAWLILYGSFSGGETVNAAVGGKLSSQWVRPYLWGPVSDGSYANVAQTPWYLYAGRWMMAASGIYLAARLGYLVFREGIENKKQWDKSLPFGGD